MPEVGSRLRNRALCRLITGGNLQRWTREYCMEDLRRVGRLEQGELEGATNVDAVFVALGVPSHGVGFRCGMELHGVDERFADAKGRISGDRAGITRFRCRCWRLS